MLQKHRGPQLFEAPVETKEIDISEKFLLKGEEVTATAEQLNNAGIGGTVASEAMIPIVQAETTEGALELLGAAPATAMASEAMIPVIQAETTEDALELLGAVSIDVLEELAIRAPLPSAIVIHVAPDGDDGDGDGTEEAPFLTIQRAVNYAFDLYDAKRYGVKIKLADGTYTAGAILSGILTGSWGWDIAIEGNTTTPANVLIAPTSGIAFYCTRGWLHISGVKIQTNNADAIRSYFTGVVGYTGIDFGACGTGSHLQIGYGGGAQALGDYTISGSAWAHIRMVDGAKHILNGRTGTLLNTPAWTAQFVNMSGACTLSALAAAFSGNATGARYYVNANSTVNTGGSGADFFPGNAAGQTVNGGQYV
jgi:hypothetical protein